MNLPKPGPVSDGLPHSRERWRRRAIFLGWAVVGTGMALVAGTMPFLLPALRRHCLPYVPATTAQTQRVLSVVKKRPVGKVVDLGSGDGRVVGGLEEDDGTQ